VGLERGPLSLVSTIEELLGSAISGFGVGNREYGLVISYADHATQIYPQNFALTSKSGGRSVGIVRSWTKAMEFSLSF
jgi:hypothetical protein